MTSFILPIAVAIGITATTVIIALLLLVAAVEKTIDAARAHSRARRARRIAEQALIRGTVSTDDFIRWMLAADAGDLARLGAGTRD